MSDPNNRNEQSMAHFLPPDSYRDRYKAKLCGLYEFRYTKLVTYEVFILIYKFVKEQQHSCLLEDRTQVCLHTVFNDEYSSGLNKP
jgi:hypothetical protein